MTDRELMQQALDALESISRYGLDTLSGRIDGPDDRNWQRAAVVEMTNRAMRGHDALRARLAQPEQTSIAEQYAHRLAILLECMVLSPDKTWNEANNLVSEYQDALHKERMNAGEPYVSGFGKD